MKFQIDIKYIKLLGIIVCGSKIFFVSFINIGGRMPFGLEFYGAWVAEVLEAVFIGLVGLYLSFDKS